MLPTCQARKHADSILCKQNLNFARVGGFHMQAEPISVIKLDASSREAGALKAEAIVHYASALITQQMRASGSCKPKQISPAM
jgi:hypothetical protein